MTFYRAHNCSVWYTFGRLSCYHKLEPILQIQICVGKLFVIELKMLCHLYVLARTQLWFERGLRKVYGVARVNFSIVTSFAVRINSWYLAFLSMMRFHSVMMLFVDEYDGGPVISEAASKEPVTVPMISGELDSKSGWSKRCRFSFSSSIVDTATKEVALTGWKFRSSDKWHP